MPEIPNNRAERYIRYALIVLALILLALVVFVAVEYHSLRQQQIIDAHMRLSQFLTRHAPFGPSDADIIRSWMTFDYVDKIFALPPDYLKTRLQITDTHYPKLTIGTTLLGEVVNAVREYVAPPKAATSTI